MKALYKGFELFLKKMILLFISIIPIVLIKKLLYNHLELNFMTYNLF